MQPLVRRRFFLPLLVLAGVVAALVVPGTAPGAFSQYKQAVLADNPKGYWRLGEPGDDAVPFADSSVPGGHAGTKRMWASGQGAGTKFYRAQPGALPGSGDDGAVLDDAAPSGFAYPNVEGAFVRAQWGTDNSINFGNTAPFSLEAWVRPKPRSVAAAVPGRVGCLGTTR
jgi:hypothetical protein